MCSDWTMFHGRDSHNGQSSGHGPRSSTVSWSFAPTDGYQTSGSSPIIGHDGVIYVVSGTPDSPTSPPGSHLDSVSPATHQSLWSWTDPTESILRSTPAVSPDGTVYLVSDQGPGNLIAVGNGGATVWKLTGLNLQGSPTIASDGTIYVMDPSSTVYAVDPTNGQVLWNFAGSPGTVGVRGTPALSRDRSRLYVPSGGGLLYALTAGASGGELQWSYQISGPPGGNIENAPAVDHEGTIYVATGGNYGSTPGNIEAVRPDGTRKWSYTSDGTFETTPAVSRRGLVVAGNDVGTITALRHHDGTVAWSYQAPGTVGTNGFYNSSAAVASGGNIYIQNQLSVFAFNHKGSLEWLADEVGPYVGASPALDGARTLLVTAIGQLLAFV